MSRKLHDGVDFSAKWIRLEKVRGLELPCERRHSLTFGKLGQKALTEPKVSLREFYFILSNTKYIVKPQ